MDAFYFFSNTYNGRIVKVLGVLLAAAAAADEVPFPSCDCCVASSLDNEQLCFKCQP